MRRERNTERGMALIEVVIATALFALLGTSVVSTMFSGFSSTKQGSDYVVASGLLQEGVAAVRSIRHRDFASLVEGTHGLDTGSGYFELNGTSDSLIGGNYTRTITIEDVLRDGNDDIAVAGTEDPSSRRVIVNVTWDTLAGKTQNIDSVFYVYDFTVNSSGWVQSSLADFSGGYFNTTMAQSGSGDGEVAMEPEDAGWGSLIQEHAVDADGSGNPVYSYLDREQDTLYVLSSNTAGDELIRFDISDVSASAPVKVDGYDVGGATTYDFEILDGYGYIATNNDAAEVHVVRIDDMTSVNTIDITGTADAYSLAISGTTLLVGMNSSGGQAEVYAFDVADPEGTIAGIDSVEIGMDCRALVAANGYAYCGSDDTDDELTVVNLSTYAVVNSSNLAGSGVVQRMRIYNDSLYIGRLNSGNDDDFLEIDVSNPESSLPVLNTLDTNSDVDGLFIDIDQEYAFLATSDNSQELTIVDLNTFTEHQWYDASSGSDAETIAQFGRFIYLLTINDTAELNVIRTQAGDWESAQLIGSANIASTSIAYSVVVDGNYAYVGTQNNGGDELYVYDVTTPSSPTLLGSEEIGGNVNDIAVNGNTLYLATSGNSTELRIVDVTTKTAPNIVGSYNMSGNGDAYGMTNAGTTVYIGRAQSNGAGQSEFWVIDASNPAAPSLIGQMEYSSPINDVIVTGTNVWGATDNNSAEFIRIDITTPASPTVATSLNVADSLDGRAIALDGNTIALGRDAGTGDELVLIDVTTPASPSELGGANIGSAVNTLVFDGLGYLYFGADGTNVELQRWDVSTPSAPVQHLTFDLNNDGMGIYFDGTNVHLATENSSLEYQIIGSTAITEEIPRQGYFTSAAFDSGSATTVWNDINWTADLGGGGGLFKMEVGSVSVDHNFTTVNLQNTYTSPVIVPLYNESANTLPISVRIDNIGVDSFDLRFQNSGDTTPLSTDIVHYLVVEEGAWTMPDGTLIEAQTLDTSVIGYKNSWSGGVAQSFTAGFVSAPAVFHQVQTYNDASWIDSWISSSSGNTDPPNSAGFKIALNGAEATTSHGSETIGWVAIETGTGTIGGVDFEASITSDSVTGHTDACSVFSFSNTYGVAPLVMVDQQEMDGADGAWAVSCSLSTTQVGMHAEEDQETDSEQTHTNETFAWAAFETAFDYAEASPATIRFRLRTASSEAGLATAVWVGPDGTEDTLYDSSGEVIMTHGGATGTRWCQYQAYFVSDGAAEPLLQDVTINYAP